MIDVLVVADDFLVTRVNSRFLDNHRGGPDVAGAANPAVEGGDYKLSTDPALEPKPLDVVGR